MVITGNVKSANNEMLIGAVVYESSVDGKPINNVAKTTDVNGNYSLNTKEANSYLTAKLIGYDAKTIKAENPTINFVLQPSASQTLSPVEIVASKPEKPPTPPPLPKSWWDRNSIYVYLGAGALATIVVVAIITSQISKPVKGA